MADTIRSRDAMGVEKTAAASRWGTMRNPWREDVLWLMVLAARRLALCRGGGLLKFKDVSDTVFGLLPTGRASCRRRLVGVTLVSADLYAVEESCWEQYDRWRNSGCRQR